MQGFGFYSIQMILVRCFQYPEKNNVHNDALKGYILGVTDLSYEKDWSEYNENRKRTNKNKLDLLNEIDDNIRDGIIQHYDDDYDPEMAEKIIKLFDLRFQKDCLECDIAISAEPVHSMEIKENLLCAMLKKLKRRDHTEEYAERKVLKAETDCEQQQWLIGAEEPPKMVKQ